MAAKKEEEKTRYSDLELAEFRELIGRKIIEGRNQFNSYIDEIEKHSASVQAKQGRDDEKEIAAIERLEGMVVRQTKHLQHLEDALMRVKSKDYGVCRESGKLISKERLKAVPHATLSVQGKKDVKVRRKKK
jgi:DnaK suppressor protein